MQIHPETITRIKIYAVTAMIVILSFLIVAILANTLVRSREQGEWLILGWLILLVLTLGPIFNFVEEKFEGEDTIERYAEYLDSYRAREQSEREQENQSDIEESLSFSDDEEDNSPITNKTQSLRELKALLDDGTITNEEFKKLKKELLD